MWRNGIRNRLKICRSIDLVGSSPTNPIMTNEENPLDYFKNLTSDSSDHIMSLQDMEKTIKFHEEELAAEDKRVEGTDEYPNYGDDFADMVYIARRISEELNNARYENNLLVQKCRELQERIDALKHQVEAKENINSTLTGAFNALRREHDEARREVCVLMQRTGFLRGDYAAERGWDCFKDNP